ncbi:hypothetical protein ACTWQB_15680 [Piscibacillus sp. B03]|uniref:hypothetical protein n=1 Tax=Piscibacillus sp. B03 TaxID=3457430 RepID=UPI003FCCE1D7
MRKTPFLKENESLLDGIGSEVSAGFNIDEVVHRTRGECWDEKTRREYESRKRKAASMLRNNQPNKVFVIAWVTNLPILTVRELEKEYLEEIENDN